MFNSGVIWVTGPGQKLVESRPRFGFETDRPRFLNLGILKAKVQFWESVLAKNPGPYLGGFSKSENPKRFFEFQRETDRPRDLTRCLDEIDLNY